MFVDLPHSGDCPLSPRLHVRLAVEKEEEKARACQTLRDSWHQHHHLVATRTSSLSFLDNRNRHLGGSSHRRVRGVGWGKHYRPLTSRIHHRIPFPHPRGVLKKNSIRNLNFCGNVVETLVEFIVWFSIALKED